MITTSKSYFCIGNVKVFHCAGNTSEQSTANAIRRIIDIQPGNCVPITVKDSIKSPAVITAIIAILADWHPALTAVKVRVGSIIVGKVYICGKLVIFVVVIYIALIDQFRQLSKLQGSTDFISLFLT
ncbi:hypothetical protein SDC9_153925 [bioreactor metagenome]|uniref:Uncharacterized protein n=1 Tax=bioreactor metagenome TaxID=1076179 RepID=A0A645EZQ7_9ZZZZ